MGDYGIKITNPGKDITSTEPTDYVFSSKYTAVKIAQESANRTFGSISVPASGTAIATAAHNLGFAPLCLIFSELTPGSGRWYQGPAIAGPEDPSGAQVYLLENGSYVDGTNLNIVYYNKTGSPITVKYYYYIFGDSSE